jgi:DNA polymerase
MSSQNLKNEYLQAMGVQRWLVRTSGERLTDDCLPVSADDLAEPLANDWSGLEMQVSGCKKCKLHETRTQTVFGSGNRQADWLIIGEAPADVYIANILKCRPPGNRNPEPEEVACCHAYLQQQIALMQPQLILAVGGVAAHNLLQTDEKVGQMRGKLHHYGDANIPLIVTYHPAYLLRSPLEKRKVWSDLQFAQAVYKQQLAV